MRRAPHLAARPLPEGDPEQPLTPGRATLALGMLFSLGAWASPWPDWQPADGKTLLADLAGDRAGFIWAIGCAVRGRYPPPGDRRPQAGGGDSAEFQPKTPTEGAAAAVLGGLVVACGTSALRDPDATRAALVCCRAVVRRTCL
jgi:hypothetical protein